MNNIFPAPPFIKFASDKSSSEYRNDCLAWNRSYSLNRGELEEWLQKLRRKSPQAEKDMRERLTKCIAWRWLVIYSKDDIDKRLFHITLPKNEVMRQFLYELESLSRENNYKVLYEHTH